MELQKIVPVLRYKRGDTVTITSLDFNWCGTYVQQATRKFIGHSAVVIGTRPCKRPYIIKPHGYSSTLCVNEEEIHV